MLEVTHIQFQNGSREEHLPGFTPEFPYIASRAQLHRYPGQFCPWHWHRPVELFYMQSGTLEYHTPGGRTVFPPGWGGLINSNVLHMTRVEPDAGPTVQLLHIFDPAFLGGAQGSRIDQRYIRPLVTDAGREVIALTPEDPAQAQTLAMLRAAFTLQEEEPGYELRLRAALSEIWLRLLAMPAPAARRDDGRNDSRVKQMLVYIHEHYPEKITISRLAAAGYASERECYRAFRDCLHTTPVAYINGYRLQIACRMLAQGTQSVTEVAQRCGLGSSSYFGKLFREQIGCSPAEYRRQWQDRDTERRE